MNRFCVICGKKLTGRQRKLCSNKECHRKQAWVRKNQKPRFCIICGKELTGRQRKLCSKKCRRKRAMDRNRDWYQNNRGRIDRYNRDYYRNNVERIKECNREWRLNNIEKRKESGRKWYQSNLERTKEYDRKCYRKVRGLPEDCDLHKESSIEKIMREWLQKNDIEFVAQYYINFENSTWTFVDFYMPEMNICLYCDGGYYHSLSNAKKCEAEQNRILPQMGYNVVRLSETEILNGIRPDLKCGV